MVQDPRLHPGATSHGETLDRKVGSLSSFASGRSAIVQGKQIHFSRVYMNTEDIAIDFFKSFS